MATLAETAADGTSKVGTAPIKSPLRHLETSAVSAAARIETRNREVHLPPVSVYRWWARRTEAVNGAILDAVAVDRPGERLLVADPFAGGAVIPLAAVIRGHRVYAQDLNPWAALGMATMLGLPEADELREAGERLRELAQATLADAYATRFSDGDAAELSHTFRVAVADCGQCGRAQRLFPHALVSLVRRKEKGQPEAFIACPSGHVSLGQSTGMQRCPSCAVDVEPTANYTPKRLVTCTDCGHVERLERLAADGGWRWEVALVERSKGRAREVALPTRAEIAKAESSDWRPILDLGEIPEGQETRVLRRHGFSRWQDLYPARQRVILERLLALAPEATDDEQTLRALKMAIIGSAEMAGHLSRWDRYYLKSYESMAGHRFNFTTFSAEPNVWGAQASGRGTVSRRLKAFSKASRWLHDRDGRDLKVDGPIAATGRRTPMASRADVRAVEGSSERMLLPAGAADLVLTDPPYHDDVQYSELSLPLRAWALLSEEELHGEALVNRARGHNAGVDDYRDLLQRIFTEARRVMHDHAHLIFSYANREPGAWSSLFNALQGAGFRAAGCELVHSENETDYAKRDVRACTLDLIIDVVPSGSVSVEYWSPPALPDTDEGAFLGIVMESFSALGSLSEGWEASFASSLFASPFLSSAG